MEGSEVYSMEGLDECDELRLSDDNSMNDVEDDVSLEGMCIKEVLKLTK